MIDVPIAVRDALKDGGYKKNYRFVVGHEVEEYYYEDVTILEIDEPYTITEAGAFRFYNPVSSNGFTYEIDNGMIVVTEEVDYMPESPSGGYAYSLPISVGMIGSTITLTRADWEIHLQKKTNDKGSFFITETTIENDNLVKESVKIDERMCSDDTLRFGLCEGSELEFQAFDIDNITGKRIQAFIDVEYPVKIYTYDEDDNITSIDERIEVYSIPMGWYDVQETSRQASTGIRKVSAYNKLKSEYLDATANALIVKKFGTATVTIGDLLEYMLEEYQIKNAVTCPWYFDKDGYIYQYANGIACNAKKDFQTIKYNSMYDGTLEQKWAFTPAAFYTNPRHRISTNTKIYVQGFADWAKIKFHYPRSGVRIKVDPLVTQIDTAIADFITTQLADPLVPSSSAFNVSINEAFNRICNMHWGYMSSVYSHTSVEHVGYFFHVAILFRDGTVKVYGDHVTNAEGTFEQLGMTTFNNVDEIHLLYPNHLSYGYRFDKAINKNWYQEIKYEEGNEYYTDEHDVRHEVHRNNQIKLRGSEDLNSYKTTPKLPNGKDIPDNIYDLFVVETLVGDIPPIEMIEVKPAELPDVTLRDLQTAVLEVECRFGRLDRTNNIFYGLELNNERLYPADSLYPDDGLFPSSTSEGGFKAVYSKLWADEGNVRSWRNLIITYKGLIKDPDTQEVSDAEKTYQIVINATGTDDYEITNNWLFKNIIWADSDTASWAEAAGLENVETYAAAMVTKMQGVKWFPFEMWCAGLPYVETGDEVEINIGDGAYTSYVLRRTIKGIQNLQDEMIDGTLDIF